MPQPRNVLPKLGSSSLPKGVDLSSNAGTSLLVILTTLAVSMVAMTGIMSIAAIRQRSQAQSFVPMQLLQIRGNIANLLRNPKSWNKILSEPSNHNLNCISSHSDCTGNDHSEISLIEDATGTTVYKLNDAGWHLPKGVTPDGNTCTTYPSLACPFTFQVMWYCSTCTNTSDYGITFQIAVKYDPEIPNPDGYGTIRSPNAVILNEDSYTTLPAFSLTSTNSYFVNP